MLTIVVRTLLFPLTVKQVRSMRAMQDLRPEMERIRAQYRDNRQRQQAEMMTLYQERNVHPLGGSLPPPAPPIGTAPCRARPYTSVAALSLKTPPPPPPPPPPP